MKPQVLTCRVVLALCTLIPPFPAQGQGVDAGAVQGKGWGQGEGGAGWGHGQWQGGGRVWAHYRVVVSEPLLTSASPPKFVKGK